MQPLLRDMAIRLGVGLMVVPKVAEYLGRQGITLLSGNQLLLAAAGPLAVAGVVSKYFRSQKFEPLVVAAASGAIAYVEQQDPRAALLTTAISYVVYRLFDYLAKPEKSELKPHEAVGKQPNQVPKIAVQEPSARQAEDAQTFLNTLARLEGSIEGLPKEVRNFWEHLFFCVQTLEEELKAEALRSKGLATRLNTLEEAQKKVLDAFTSVGPLSERLTALEASHNAASEAFLEFRSRFSESSSSSSSASSN